jgi:hypothetical protein
MNEGTRNQLEDRIPDEEPEPRLENSKRMGQTEEPEPRSRNSKGVDRDKVNTTQACSESQDQQVDSRCLLKSGQQQRNRNSGLKG